MVNVEGRFLVATIASYKALWLRLWVYTVASAYSSSWRVQLKWREEASERDEEETSATGEPDHGRPL